MQNNTSLVINGEVTRNKNFLDHVTYLLYCIDEALIWLKFTFHVSEI